MTKTNITNPVLLDLMQKHINLGIEIEVAEERLKKKKQELKQISEIEFPEAVAELGLVGLDGKANVNGVEYRIKLSNFYSASIPKDRIDEAHDWLRDNNHGDLIKNTITIDYGKGEDTKAEAMKMTLRDDKQKFSSKTGVHHQTLGGWVKEQTEKGQTLPMDLLGIYIGQKTSIKED